MEKGRFITLEGGEGTGKSTQIRLLADSLTACGVTVQVTREPGGSTGAEEIRRLLVEGEPGRWGAMTEALLHTAARRDHMERTVWPALEAGRWVICDRFFDSTMAYQGYGHRLGREMICSLQRLALGDFRPDLTAILDLPVSEGLARAGARRGTETRYEQMALSFHERLREGFRDIAAREPERCVLIDASHPIEAVQAALLDAVTRRLKVPTR